jgi:hypothetical protein
VSEVNKALQVRIMEACGWGCGQNWAVEEEETFMLAGGANREPEGPWI